MDLDWELLESSDGGDQKMSEKRKSNTFPRQAAKAFQNAAAVAAAAAEGDLGHGYHSPVRFAPTPEDPDSDGTQGGVAGYAYHEGAVPYSKGIMKKEYSPLVGYDTDVDR